MELAREAEALGFHRFWVSEHHGVPGVAGSAPTVLAAAVASATSAIRVGTGGVMLPNHRPLVVAEQFGVLASLFPGRIDMGLGRSVGFTDGVRRALGHGKEDAEDFPGRLEELLGWIDGTQKAHPGVRARPAEGLDVPAYVLAVGEGASVAAAAGLPLVIGDLRGREKVLRAIEVYRRDFRPSARAERPEVIVAGTVAVAETEEAARCSYRRRGPWRTPGRAGSSRRWRYRVEALTMTAKERTLYERGLDGHIHGTEEQVAALLERAIDETGADEVLVTTSTYDREALVGSLRGLARIARLPDRTGYPAALHNGGAR